MKRVFTGIRELLTLAGVAKKQGRHPTENDLGRIENAAVVVGATGLIEWVGPQNALPKTEGAERTDCQDAVWLPSLVECHTHLIFAGHRFRDYASRCAGKTYQEVAAAGGGILSTIRDTRAASADALLAHAREELRRFRALGAGPIEIKTGYGLDWQSELRQLECIEALRKESPLPIVSTFLPAHAVPPEFKGRPDDYVDLICREWLPEVARRKLTRFVDTFIEEGYFSLAHGKRIAETAAALGLGNKLHAEQFTDLGSASLAVDLGATSCDHLDHISAASIGKLARSLTVAVLLPGASLFTGTPYPPARRLIEEGARVALSTDYNPGTCPSRSLPLMATLACSQMKMTLAESLAGLTYNAAAALGLETELGSLEAGKRFAVTELHEPSYEAFAYRFGELELALRY